MANVFRYYVSLASGKSVTITIGDESFLIHKKGLRRDQHTDDDPITFGRYRDYLYDHQLAVRGPPERIRDRIDYNALIDFLTPPGSPLRELIVDLYNFKGKRRWIAETVPEERNAEFLHDLMTAKYDKAVPRARLLLEYDQRPVDYYTTAAEEGLDVDSSGTDDDSEDDDGYHDSGSD
ncbi:hypothetical protein LTR17_019629 [Elasticomyces elasticus]|nr:hypothetical protein LTR17_019629 [Elasticomyces elasticus]